MKTFVESLYEPLNINAFIEVDICSNIMKDYNHGVDTTDRGNLYSLELSVEVNKGVFHSSQGSFKVSKNNFKRKIQILLKHLCFFLSSMLTF